MRLLFAWSTSGFVVWLVLFASLFVYPHGVESGKIQFATDVLVLPSSMQMANVSVLRLAGHNGSVSAEIIIFGSMDSVNTSWNINWEGGDMSTKIIALQRQMLNDSTHSVQLLIKETIPSVAKGFRFQSFLLVLSDYVPWGLVAFSSQRVLIPNEPSTINDECLLYATRSIRLERRDHVEVNLVPCGPPYKDAMAGEDFEFFPRQRGALVWEPGEYDTRCLVRNLRHLLDQSASDHDASGIFLWPDADPEDAESICLSHTLEPFSESVLYAHRGDQTYGSYSLLLISVSDSATGKEHDFICKRGLECSVDFEWANLYPTDTVFYSLTQCPTACSNYSNESSILAMQLPWNVDHIINLQPLAPVVFCVCRANYATGHPRSLGSLVLEGPTLDNAASCKKGAPTCTVVLNTLSPSIEDESIRIMSNCKEFSSHIAGIKGNMKEAFERNALYILEDVVAMQQASPGNYQICWCRKSIVKNCQNIQDYDTVVGSFSYVGPYIVGDLHVTLGTEWVLTDVWGVGITVDSKVRYLHECGSEFADSVPFEATCGPDVRSYYFGILDHPSMKAHTYRLCWCQPDTESDCISAQHFVVEFGTVTFHCPSGYGKQADGECRACSIWQRSSKHADECVGDDLHSSLLSFSLVFGMLGFAVFLGQFDCRRTSNKRYCPYRLQGRSISLTDVSLQDDGTFITTHGCHYLLQDHAALQVIFLGTGHHLLDTTKACRRKFKVVAIGSQRLRLLDSNNSSLSFRVDSSRGFIVLRPLDALVQTRICEYFPALLFVCACLIGVLVVRLVLVMEARPSWLWWLAPMYAFDLVGASLLRCAWRRRHMPTGLETALKLYDRRLSSRNPKPEPCEHGPSRAVSAFQLFDLHEFFQEFIRDRTMYYIDPHITKPLTAAYRLSYAERAGPHDVKWFCSHYWGTQFMHFCETIRRHALATVESAVNGSMNQIYTSNVQDESWKKSSYWICTFSNNQYNLDEELGGHDHKKSSFYLALHSPTCQGTCMILDELALPLTRSWCLFELLQTIQLKQRRADFSGLLFCTATGVLNYGEASVAVALNIGDRIATLRLEDAEASDERDKEMISSLVLADMGSFDEINSALREEVSSALRVCKAHVESHFEVIFQALHHHCSPRRYPGQRP